MTLRSDAANRLAATWPYYVPIAMNTASDSPAAFCLAAICASKYGSTMEVELSERAQRILQKLQPASDLAGSIEAVTLDALRMRLRDVVGQLGAFEARHGRTFEQFAGDWNVGRLTGRFSHSTERTFMEWEALTMERRELLDLIRELAAPVDAAS